MRRNRAALLWGFAFCLAAAADMQAEDVITIAYPYLGITHITRVGSPPDFPRNVKIHVVKIDLTAPFLSFQFTPHTGTRDTVRQTTLQYLDSVGAQVAINGSFFLPFPSADFNSALVGFAASNGTVYSPFEIRYRTSGRSPGERRGEDLYAYRYVDGFSRKRRYNDRDVHGATRSEELTPDRFISRHESLQRLEILSRH